MAGKSWEKRTSGQYRKTTDHHTLNQYYPCDTPHGYLLRLLTTYVHRGQSTKTESSNVDMEHIRCGIDPTYPFLSLINSIQVKQFGPVTTVPHELPVVTFIKITYNLQQSLLKSL